MENSLLKLREANKIKPAAKAIQIFIFNPLSTAEISTG